MSDFIHQGLQKLAQKIEDWLQMPGFEAQVVPEQFACLYSESFSPALMLKTYRFEHPALLHITWALLSERDSGAYRAITLYALPKPELALPILGLDYVGLGGMIPIAALDLAPTDDDFWQISVQPVLEMLHREHIDLIARKIPAFAEQVFSKKVLLMATRTESGCIHLVNLVLSVIEKYAEWLFDPPVSTVN